MSARNLPPLPDPGPAMFVTIAQGGRAAIHGAYQAEEMRFYGLSCAAAARAQALEEAAKLCDAVVAAWSKSAADHEAYDAGQCGAAEELAAAIRKLGEKM